ncbi:Thiazole biosynthesis protein ThiG [invertebrate metagenome]|uniref:thiazole synthase n=1 Tax=invertebrate metagenome TaxID=1711999 RepID=A0A484H5D2_9ZZZZ
MRLIINDKEQIFAGPVSISVVLSSLGLDPSKVAVERNLEIVPRSAYTDTLLDEGDRLEIVHFIGGGVLETQSRSVTEDEIDFLEVAGRRFRSRLLVGTGKYRDFTETARAIAASGAEIVTVAVRRVNLSDPSQPMLIDHVDPRRYTYLPNTAGCHTAEEAIRTLHLARESGGWDLVKLEVFGDQKTLYPDMIETLRATEQLVRDGFKVMVYCSEDVIFARRLEELGCVAIMPLAAPIGSGLGIRNPMNIRLIVEQTQLPVLVDAGVGTASDATVAMELGCDGILMNTAIAEARDPVRMAQAMKKAVEAGRLAYLSGRMPRKLYADPSSPLSGLI